jgi:hypothetical protein
LKKTIEEGEFEVLEMNGILGPEATALQLLQDAASARVSKSWRKHYFRYMQWRIRRADERCTPEARSRDACVYVVVAKPA